jgi:hypothetical protein
VKGLRSIGFRTYRRRTQKSKNILLSAQSIFSHYKRVQLDHDVNLAACAMTSQVACDLAKEP